MSEWPNNCYTVGCSWLSKTGICGLNGKKAWLILKNQIPCPFNAQFNSLDVYNNRNAKQRCKECGELCERLLGGMCDECYINSLRT